MVQQTKNITYCVKKKKTINMCKKNKTKGARDRVFEKETKVHGS